MRVSATALSQEPQLAAFVRACDLDDRGRSDEAVRAYMDVLSGEPSHVGALANLGTLFFERARLDIAGQCFLEAARRHPLDALSQCNAAEWYAKSGDDALAEVAYRKALDIEASFVHAHLGLSRLYARGGDAAAAQRSVDRAYKTPVAYTYPFRGQCEPLRLLHVISATGGEIVSDLFFDDTVVERCVLVAESVRDTPVVATFHVLFNAIGDVEQSPVGLERARAIAAETSGAVINDPSAVLRTGRVEMMRRARAIPGVVAPRTERFEKSNLTAQRLLDSGFVFPLLVRSPGFHAGAHFIAVEQPGDFADSVEALPGSDVLVIEFLDVRGSDGSTRKYRAVCVDGCMYPVHLAISDHWKVHYFSANMADRPDHRAEEADYLSDMGAVLGSANIATLHALFAMMGLDYGGVDFAIASNGAIVVFEANATMAVYPPAPGEHWDYRRTAVERVIGAVRAMFVSRAKSKGYL